jgi:hypothetical protein
VKIEAEEKKKMSKRKREAISYSAKQIHGEGAMVKERPKRFA